MTSSSQSFSKPSPGLLSDTGESYWSIDDFLAGQERLPCRIEEPLYRLGFLSTHSTEEHLLPGTKIELPLWLARTLCNRKRRVVSVQLPKAYREVMRTALSADATVVDLHRNGPYYYAVGVSLLHLDFPERGELAKTLLETFITRFRYIMDSSHNAYLVDTMQLTSRLDELEKYLFSLGQQALVDQVNWEKGNSRRIEMSHLVDTSTSRKRKRGDDTDR